MPLVTPVTTSVNADLVVPVRPVSPAAAVNAHSGGFGPARWAARIGIAGWRCHSSCLSPDGRRKEGISDHSEGDVDESLNTARLGTRQIPSDQYLQGE